MLTRFQDEKTNSEHVALQITFATRIDIII